MASTLTPSLLANTTHGTFPASYNQKTLHDLQLSQPTCPDYNVFQGLRYDCLAPGKLDPMIWIKCMKHIAGRHAVFRTKYQLASNGNLYQVVLPLEEVDIEKIMTVIDLSKHEELTVKERETAAMEMINKAIKTAFDLYAAPPWRMLILTITDKEVYLVNVMHHIMTDGASMNLLLKELTAFGNHYRWGLPLEIPPVQKQYVDLAVWQIQQAEGPGWVNHIQYWKQKLAGLPSLNVIPTDFPTPPGPPGDFHQYKIRVPAELAIKMKELGKKIGATAFQTLLAVYKAIMAKYTGVEDVVVGSPFANRSRPEYKDCLGYFRNVMVLRSSLAGNPSYTQLVQERVRPTCLQAYDHAEVPVGKVKELVKFQEYNGFTPIYQNYFILQQDKPMDRPIQGRGGIITVTPLGGGSGSANTRIHLCMEFYPDTDGSFYGDFEYRIDTYKEETVAKIWQNYLALLKACVEDPDVPIMDHQLPHPIPPRVHPCGHNDCVQVKSLEHVCCVREAFEAQVSICAAGVALSMGDEHMTWEQIDIHSNQIAHLLIDRGLKPGNCVAVLMTRGLDLALGLLAVLKAGGCILLLDMKDREGCVGAAKAAQCRFIFTHGKRNEKIKQAVGHSITILDLDADWDDIKKSEHQFPTLSTPCVNLPAALEVDLGAPYAKRASYSHEQLYQMCKNRGKVPPLTRVQFDSADTMEILLALLGPWVNGDRALVL